MLSELYWPPTGNGQHTDTDTSRQNSQQWGQTESVLYLGSLDTHVSSENKIWLELPFLSETVGTYSYFSSTWAGFLVSSNLHTNNPPPSPHTHTHKKKRILRTLLLQQLLPRSCSESWRVCWRLTRGDTEQRRCRGLVGGVGWVRDTHTQHYPQVGCSTEQQHHHQQQQTQMGKWLTPNTLTSWEDW